MGGRESKRMSAEVEIRQAKLEDFEEIAQFDMWGGDRKKEIAQGFVFVAGQEGKIVGYITLDQSFYERPFLRYICIRRELRRKGIGELFMRFAEEQYKGKDLFSSTESDNLPMLQLFKKNGYKISGWIENLQESAEIIYYKNLK